MNRIQVLPLVVAAFGVAIGLSSGAIAQNADTGQAAQGGAQDAQAAPTAQNTATTGGLQEVVVTAERRAEDVQSTPIVILATSADQLREEHVGSITDLQFTTPTLTVNTSGDFLSDINIRGVGQNSEAGAQVTLGVEVLRDGVMAGEVTTLDAPFFDLRDTEILEGPQGVLGGGSSTGGAMQINTADPNFRGLNGYVETTVANYTDQRVDGAVNLPVNDTFAVRVAFNEETRNSFYRNQSANSGPDNCCESGDVNEIWQIGDVDNKNMRLGALWKPTNNFQVLWKWEYDDDNHGGIAGEPVPTPFNQTFAIGSCGETGPNGEIECGALGSGPVAHTTFYYAGEQPFVLNYGNLLSNEALGATESEYREQYSRYLMDLRYTLADGIQIRSLSAMQNTDVSLVYWQSDSPANDGYNWHELGPNDNYYSEEINIISPTTGKLNWIAGAFWFYRHTPVPTTSEVFAPPYPANALPIRLSLTDGTTDDRIAALFGNVNYQFTDFWQLQVGVRENWDNEEAREEPFDAQYTYPFGPGNTTPGTPFPINCTGANVVPAGGSFISCNRNYGHWKDDATTGKIDLNYTPIPGQNFYVFYARGYKAGGVSGSDATFNPEYLSDYELGWKGTLAGGHIVTQTGIYYMVYQNMQLNLFNIYNQPAPASAELNAATSTIKGLELSAQSRFGPVGFDLGFDYNNSRMGNVSVPNPAFLPGGTIPGTAADVFNTGTGPPQCGAVPTKGCFNYIPYAPSVSGEQMIMAPTYTGRVDAHYAFPVGANGALEPLVSFSYTSSQYGNIFQVPYYYVQPRHILGANLTYTNGSWLAEAYGTNLTNEIYIQSFAGGYATFGYGAPRQFGLRFEYNFGGAAAGGAGN